MVAKQNTSEAAAFSESGIESNRKKNPLHQAVEGKC